MKIKQPTAYYAGIKSLHPLSEEEVEDLLKKRWYKVRKTQHVQEMEQLINTSFSVPPTEIDNVILAYEVPGAATHQFVLLSEDEDGDPAIIGVRFLGKAPGPEILTPLEGKTKAELIIERFEHVPPRTILP